MHVLIPSICCNNCFSHLGKKGHTAFQRIDQIYEIQDEAYKNLETEITIL